MRQHWERKVQPIFRKSDCCIGRVSNSRVIGTLGSEFFPKVLICSRTSGLVVLSQFHIYEYGVTQDLTAISCVFLRLWRGRLYEL